ncbi:tyrosine-type recombinase/integrase [Paenibacillus chibensis]|uniref:tyrosine-type recombinase/integrase n=1 Tax=Paenibacillus chibensis TaxID=59846 RepID=UPI000FDB0E96|nr:tyrosine-type recombinase/integrase [Paenibacillus chibensis]MEC0370869.1 tyrosine-type recombinase/integrase [Paenibacillus chibensis]
MNTVQPIRDPALIEAMKNYLRCTSERNYIFFCMGIYSGLRVSDLLELQVKSVRNQTHISLVEKKTENTKKRNKKKKFIIHRDLVDDLNSYIKGMDDNAYLFPSRQKKTTTGERGKPIDRSTAYKMLNNVADRFGLVEIGCHTLRKTWGYHLYLENPRNLALLMDMFNHSDPTYTLMYLGLTQDAMDAAIMRLSYT